MLVVILLWELVVRQQAAVDIAVEQVVLSKLKEYLCLRQVCLLSLLITLKKTRANVLGVLIRVIISYELCLHQGVLT